VTARESWFSGGAVQRFYRYQAYVYDYTRWTILHGRRRAVHALELQPDSRVLEIGCGTGLNFRHILRRLDAARGKLVGIDFSRDMLKQAERRCARKAWRNVELLHADATALDLTERFDAAFFGYTALSRVWEHLVPGGRLVVLDFGRFERWGPAGALMRGWLRANHVETRRPYVEKMRAICGVVETKTWLGGYNFTAVARR
jgi:S-adenosylmethionine-diacylgycerolhomoserine-N-methlytransferase